MKRFVEGTDRGQSTLFSECLEDWNRELKSSRRFVSKFDAVRRFPPPWSVKELEESFVVMSVYRNG
jgi:hypothetical protein